MKCVVPSCQNQAQEGKLFCESCETAVTVFYDDDGQIHTVYHLGVRYRVERADGQDPKLVPDTDDPMF